MQVNATIDASDLLALGIFPITVVNFAPGGGVSGPILFTVNKAKQTITFAPMPSRTIGEPDLISRLPPAQIFR